MFEKLQQRFMTPFGRELLSALTSPGNHWNVDSGGSYDTWTHSGSGLQLYVSETRVRIRDIPHLSMTDDTRRKLLNSWDARVLRRACRKGLTQCEHAKVLDARDTAINLLRLSLHKEKENA